LEFHGIFWRQKTSPWAIIRRCLRDPIYVILRLAILVQYRRVTDGHMTTAYTALP